MKRIASIALAVSVALASGLSVPASAVGCISGGDGSEALPHVICLPSEFAALQNSPSGNYVLGADIDLAGVTWSQNSSFDGTLDGVGHVVSNLSIESNGSTQVNGLFDDLQEESVIKNIRFKNAYLNVNARGYAGILAYGIYGLVDNVQIDGTVITNTVYTGGFSGQLNGGVISNSISNLSITNTSNSYVAGFAGTVGGTPNASNGHIVNSMFIGTISGGITSPIALDGMPWWDFNDPNPPMPTCDYATNTYFVSNATSNPRGCGSSISPEDLKSASTTSAGFTTWDQTKWFFGSAVHYPQLKLFVDAPSEALLPVASARPAGIVVSWLMPIGDLVDSFQVQTRTASTTWVDAPITVTNGVNMLTGLRNGTAYWVRMASVNDGGWGAWNYVAGSITPIGLADTVKVASAKSKKSIVTINWLAPVSNNGSAVTNYTVGVFKTAKAAKPFKLVAVKTKLTAALKGLKAGATVWLAVKAQNGAGTNVYGAKVKVKVVK